MTIMTSKSPGPPKNVPLGPVFDRLWFNTTEGDKEIKQLQTIKRDKNKNRIQKWCIFDKILFIVENKTSFKGAGISPK